MRRLLVLFALVCPLSLFIAGCGDSSTKPAENFSEQQKEQIKEQMKKNMAKTMQNAAGQGASPGAAKK